MKSFKYLLAFLLLISCVITSCEKEGPMGPAGPKGETGEGIPGAKGEKGDSGGFTFKEFTYSDITIPAGIGSNYLFDFAVTKEEFEKSLVMLYVSAGNDNANWLVMPGIGTGGAHEYRVWYAFLDSGTTSRAILQRSRGPEDQEQTYLSGRIVVIPLESVAAMKASGINTNNANEVKMALKL